MSYVKDGLAKAWASHLAEATGLPVFPHRREGRTEPPFTVVVVKRLSPLAPGVNTHLAEVRIVHVSDGAAPESEHHERVGVLHEAIEATPRPARDEGNNVVLLGFSLDSIEQVSAGGEDEKKVIADVFIITAGAQGFGSPGSW